MKIEKKFYKEINGYKIYLVNGILLRRTITLDDIKKGEDLTMADFLDYGIHSTSKKRNVDEFPQIPKDEIWIDDELSGTEKQINILTALNHLELLKSGVNDKIATKQADEYDDQLRDVLLCNRHANLKIKKYAKIGKGEDKVTVWIVDGDAVRDKFGSLYVKGGHGYVYDFVPKNEIWIADMKDKDEFIAVLVHEFTERNLMKNEGMSYKDAHKKATLKEYWVRDDESKN